MCRRWHDSHASDHLLPHHHPSYSSCSSNISWMFGPSSSEHSHQSTCWRSSQPAARLIGLVPFQQRKSLLVEVGLNFYAIHHIPNLVDKIWMWYPKPHPWYPWVCWCLLHIRSPLNWSYCILPSMLVGQSRRVCGVFLLPILPAIADIAIQKPSKTIRGSI